jgi:signal transduction histidine kinase
MQSKGSTYLTDWLAVTLRWLYLIGFVIAIGIGGDLSTEMLVVFLCASIWNVVLTVLVALHRRIVAHQYLSVFGDVVIATLVFMVGAAFGGHIAWVGLLPVSTAALYFQLGGSLILSIGFIIIQGIVALLLSSPFTALIYLSVLVLLYLVYGTMVGFIVKRMQMISRKAERAQLWSIREAERMEHERIRSIYKLVSALNASLNYERVLETALDIGYRNLVTTNQLDERMVSAVLLFTGGDHTEKRLRVGSARRFTSADLRLTIPGTQGLIGETIEEGAPKLASNIADDPEMSRFIALRACSVAYCIPLRIDLDTYGVLLYAHPNEKFFTPERREIFGIIGSQAVVAIQNARLYRDLELEKERMMEIQEEARKKLARDLHDGPTQSVAAMAMRTNYVRRLMDQDPKQAADELYKIEDLARQTTKEIRHMLFTLRPLVLESHGLIAALESMAEKMKDTYEQDVTIAADPKIIDQLEMGKQGVIFYIAEEAVNNARKHARAAHIWVRLKPYAEELALLEIEDNGVGFNVNKLNQGYENRGSLGMVNMQERSELVNGVLEVESAEGKGTRIAVIIPLTDHAVERVRRGL